MKISSVLLICFTTVVTCAPQSHTHDSGSSSISTKDEVAMGKINDIFEEARHTIEKQTGPLKMLGSVLLNSVDKSCMLNNYKNHGLIDKIPNIKLQPTEADIIVLLGIARTCSSKTQYSIEFMFEAFMSTHPLLQAFIHEPEFKEIADTLLCVNSYAVKNKYIDPEVYKINHTLSRSAEASCNVQTEKVLKEIDHDEDKYGNTMSAECIKEIVDGVKTVVLKYGLLVQIELSGEQKKKLKDNFVKEVRKNDEKLVVCAENSIKTGSV